MPALGLAGTVAVDFFSAFIRSREEDATSNCSLYEMCPRPCGQLDVERANVALDGSFAPMNVSRDLLALHSVSKAAKDCFFGFGKRRRIQDDSPALSHGSLGYDRAVETALGLCDNRGAPRVTGHLRNSSPGRARGTPSHAWSGYVRPKAKCETI